MIVWRGVSTCPVTRPRFVQCGHGLVGDSARREPRGHCVPRREPGNEKKIVTHLSTPCPPFLRGEFMCERTQKCPALKTHLIPVNYSLFRGGADKCFFAPDYGLSLGKISTKYTITQRMGSQFPAKLGILLRTFPGWASS